MGKKSAGIILYRKKYNSIEVLLVHPGGPFWAKKDKSVWSIPKGEFDDETPLTAAKREFAEELGSEINCENFVALSPVKSGKSKTVFAFTTENDFDSSHIKSNIIRIDWPPHSGKTIEIPEVDKAAWFDINIAKEKIVRYQLPLLDELLHTIKNTEKNS
ncbi:MAG: NUDIX domain-containing protein [Bacteroidetes bacterium]|nr:NUDIX domain-containing protein [Bacteroidota bacterium]